MITEPGKRKLKFFMGGLVLIAFAINSFFLKKEDSQPRTAHETPTESSAIQPSQPQRSGADNGAAFQAVAGEKSREGAARKAAQEAAVEHARYLARYLDTPFTRKPGRRAAAIVVASEDGKFNSAVAAALRNHLSTESNEFVSSFFKPEFVSDSLFAKVFGGSKDVLKKLEVAASLDSLVLARQTVQYSTNASLQNVITANMQLEVRIVPVIGTIQSDTWTFTANGAGFNQAAARSMAEERLLKELASDTKMSMN
jgi:hypothetical protein